MKHPILKTQEIPYEHPDSKYMFQPGPNKPFVATQAAISMYQESVRHCLSQLQLLAIEKKGLDYFQRFDDPDRPEGLWIIEDDEGGAITALLPSDY
jgi:hypothetical protein